VGSTLWLLILAFVFLPKSHLLGLIFLGCGLLPNVAGFVLWSHRDRIAPYPALQWLIVAIGVCSSAALLSVEMLTFPGQADPRFEPFPHSIYLVLLIFPALLLEFYLLERDARRANAANEKTSNGQAKEP